MPRPLSGSVLPRDGAGGVRTWDVKIRDVRKLVGREPEWSEARTRRLLDDVLVPAAKLGEPWWERIPNATPERIGADALDFHSAASDYVHAIRSRSTNKSTRDVYVAPVLNHLLPFFAYEDTGRMRARSMADITGTLVSDYTALKQTERDILRELPDILAELDDEVLRDPKALEAQLDAREWELLARYGQRGGRWRLRDPAARGRVSLSSRGLSNNEINRSLTRLRDIVRMTNNAYRLDLQDPTVDRRLTRTDPTRTWIHPHQLQAMFDAAAELDAGAVHETRERQAMRHGQLVTIRAHQRRSHYAELGRVDALMALAFAGPRVSEFGDARWSDVYLSEGTWNIPDSKTSAGRRDIELHAILADSLRARYERLEPDDGDYVWATSEDTRRDRNNVRSRLLAPVLARASELLAERAQRPLPRITPHSFRRTYLTYLSWAGRPTRYAMQQAGHKAARLALECYQQAVPRDEEQKAMVERWLA